jgi:flagellar basal-body rod protein FlgB
MPDEPGAAEAQMIQKMLFGGRGWSDLKGALDAGAVRQRVIASNIANANTPGYQAQDVTFAEVLSGEQGSLPMAKTSPEHLAGDAAPTLQPVVKPRGEKVPAGSINDVVIEREMNEMVQNTVHFQAVAQLLANRYKGLRDAIRPGA